MGQPVVDWGDFARSPDRIWSLDDFRQRAGGQSVLHWLAETGAALRALYAAHAGAAGRMADALLEDASR